MSADFENFRHWRSLSLKVDCIYNFGKSDTETSGIGLTNYIVYNIKKIKNILCMICETNYCVLCNKRLSIV